MTSYCFRYVDSRMAEFNPQNLSLQISDRYIDIYKYIFVYIYIFTYIEHMLHMHNTTYK